MSSGGPGPALSSGGSGGSGSGGSDSGSGPALSSGRPALLSGHPALSSGRPAVSSGGSDSGPALSLSSGSPGLDGPGGFGPVIKVTMTQSVGKRPRSKPVFASQLVSRSIMRKRKLSETALKNADADAEKIRLQKVAELRREAAKAKR